MLIRAQFHGKGRCRREERRASVRREGSGSMRNEAKSGAWRLERTGDGGRGGGVVLGGVPAYRGRGAGGVGGGLRNEPNFRVFRLGKISYGGVHVGLVLPAESVAAFQFRKVVEES